MTVRRALKTLAALVAAASCLESAAAQTGNPSGMLLWPVVALHAIFAVLLARGSSSDEASKR
jgi:hypothetical protein